MMNPFNSKVLLILKFVVIISAGGVDKRALQPSHEKSQQEKWSDSFLNAHQVNKEQNLSVLLKKITSTYLLDCTPVILFDSFTEEKDNLLLEQLLTNFPTAYIHGKISDDNKIRLKISINEMQPTCMSYFLFMKDVMKSKDVIGVQNSDRVIVIARSSQWRVFEFLSDQESRYFVNLLVIVQSERVMAANEEAPYILYTHRLYVDALGTSKPVVLSSFQGGSFTRDVNLFPKKLNKGFSGHRFIIALSHQPPFVILRRTLEGDNIFEGVEIRLVNLLSNIYNFTTDFREATNDIRVGSAEAVTKIVELQKANIGIGGIYVTPDKLSRTGMTTWHSRDCAAFISLASRALPRYRAILGPFHWSVWLALILVYLGGIFPLAISEKLSLKHLIKNPEEMENMFWYVFGTFTNCFTFTGKGSWSKAEKVTTKVLIGFYWLFTIIITACYTGSIIAFVTLPIASAVVDTANQLVSGWYQIGTLDTGEWRYLFQNSSDDVAVKLMKNLDLVSTVEEGIKILLHGIPFGNMPFLDLEHSWNILGKRSILHITKECFVPFGVGLTYPMDSVYGEVLSRGITLIKEAGIMNKIKSDVEWETLRSTTGKHLAANSEVGLKTLIYDDRALSLDDTQGMFLLLAIGFVAAGVALIFEWFGGCYKICRRNERRGSDETIESNPRVHERQTTKHYAVIKRSFDNNIMNKENMDHNTMEKDKHFEQIDNMIDQLFDEVLKGNDQESSTNKEYLTETASKI